MNAYFTKSSAPAAAELQPNAKWQFFSDEGRGLAAALTDKIRETLMAGAAWKG